ncbi:MAG: hypothetical protein ACHBN1_27485 [Heteroscytonema crispum UTEX LB 1556]
MLKERGKGKGERGQGDKERGRQGKGRRVWGQKGQMPNAQGTPDAWVGKPSRSTGATMPISPFPMPNDARCFKPGNHARQSLMGSHCGQGGVSSFFAMTAWKPRQFLTVGEADSKELPPLLAALPHQRTGATMPIRH